MEFKIGDKAVYPAYGIGVIEKIEHKEIAGEEHRFYILQIINSGVKLMIPIASSHLAGMREVITGKEADDIYSILKSKGRINKKAWNRRFREFNDKLKTGSILDIAEVMRDLCTLKAGKDLSFGEKKMLDKARSLIVSELSVVHSKNEKDIEQELSQLMAL